MKGAMKRGVVRACVSVLSLSQLADMAAAPKVEPSVTRLRTGPHFSVLTGVAGQRVTLADPTQGALMWTLN